MRDARATERDTARAERGRRHAGALLGALAVLWSAAAGGCFGDEGPSVREVSLVVAPLDEAGPYAVRAVVESPYGLHRVSAAYRVDAGAWRSVELAPASFEEGRDTARVWDGGMPGQPLGTRVEWHVVAEDTRGIRAWWPSTAPGVSLSFRVGERPAPPEPPPDAGASADGSSRPGAVDAGSRRGAGREEAP